MKRIVLCFDGTWNKPADASLPAADQIETNVCRFYQAVAARGADGIAQVKWYNEGVGVHLYDHLIGGAFGAGLDLHILAGYRQLVDTYEDDDEVYILGFSRGAYTARSLVGMIRNCGLVKKSLGSWEVGAAYGIYRTRQDGPDSEAAQGFRKLFAREIKIRFVGVWDTVGALGIPLPIANKLNLEFYQFHDTRLSNIVENAYQAIALDEHRQNYKVCLWDPSEKPVQKIEQRWFVGAHADVGGGYAERQLSDLTLRWMQDQAAALGLNQELMALGADNFRGPLHDSYKEFLDGLIAEVEPPYYRQVLSTRFGNERLDPSIDQRRRIVGLDYQPRNPNLPALVG